MGDVEGGVASSHLIEIDHHQSAVVEKGMLVVEVLVDRDACRYTHLGGEHVEPSQQLRRRRRGSGMVMHHDLGPRDEVRVLVGHIESAVEADAQAVESGQPARCVHHRFTSLASLETVERAAGSGHIYRHAEVGQMCERSGYPALVACGVCCVELFDHSVELVGSL